MYKKRNSDGFTIIEILVTVSILVILTSVVVASLAPARERSRDSQRQTDLRTMEAALALYKNKYGIYPEACNGPTTGTSPIWSGESGSGVGYQCNPASTQYIVGLAPEFIPKLPTDPKPDGDGSGYMYAVNNDRTVYKLMALNTVETEVVEEYHQFFRCGPEYGSRTDMTDTTTGASYNDSEICERVPPDLTNSYNPSGYPSPDACTDVDEYGASYAVSFGFSDDTRGLSGASANKGREYDTENVRCG